MKRDMDLIRAILLKIEEDILWRPKLYNFQFGNQKLSVEGNSDEEVYAHLIMLLGSPFIIGERFLSGEIKVKELTWEGREFLDSIRGDNIWKKTKAGVEKVGGVGLGFAWEIAKGIAKSELKAKLGIDAA